MAVMTAPYVPRLKLGLRDGVMTAAAAVLAYLPAYSLGISQGFWGAIIAIAVVQSEFEATEQIARNQFIGAAVGGLVGLIALLTFGDHVAVYAVAVVLVMAACSLLNVMSASRLAGITCTIVMLVPPTGTPLEMFLARVGEVAWGAFIGLSVVWVADRLSRFFTPQSDR